MWGLLVLQLLLSRIRAYAPQLRLRDGDRDDTVVQVDFLTAPHEMPTLLSIRPRLPVMSTTNPTIL